MTHYSTTHLRRLFNVRSERLLRSVFGRHFRVWLAIQIKMLNGQVSPDGMHALYNRWAAMHRKELTQAADDNVPGVYLV